MRKTALAIGAAVSICLAGGAGTALATAHHPAPAASSKLRVTLSPAKAKSGKFNTATLHNAKKGVNYVCIQAVAKKGVKLGQKDGVTTSVQLNIKAKHGKATCHMIFFPFKADGHHCPPTKADKKKGWGCGVAFADPAHRSHYAVGLYKF